MSLNQINKLFAFSFAITFSILFSACNETRIFEQNKELVSDGWKESDSLLYEFSIKENAVPLNFYYNIRYSREYPYYNLYVKHTIYDSTGKELTSKLMNMDLFDPVTGKPKGSGLGDVFDYQVLFLKNYQLPNEGKYYLKAKHYMRDEPLQGISNFGLKIEKVPENSEN